MSDRVILHPPTAPTFVVSTARSGSTLLRWLLDSHPDIACPGETDLAGLVAGYVGTAGRLGNPGGAQATLAGAREVANGLMDRYLEGSGKRRWVDKSITSALHLDVLRAVWPEARFVFLYRHCMDVVASGLEAQPWGLSDYGFADFAKASPTDHVAALAAYWLDRTTRMLQGEAALQGRSTRIRYEDLVDDPDRALNPVWDLLGVSTAPDVARNAFVETHDAAGPADYKVWQTSSVRSDSVGRGARIPADRVTGRLREAVNESLGELGYPLVDDRWGCPGPRPAGPGSDAGLVDLRIVDGHRVLWRGVLREHDGSLHDPRTVPPAGAVVVVEREALPTLAPDRAAVAVAVRAGTVRCYGATFGSYGGERRVLASVGAFLSRHAGDLVEATAPAEAA